MTPLRMAGNLIVEDNVEEKAMHRQAAVVLDTALLAELVQEKLPRDRVGPIISTSVPWLIFARAGSGFPPW